MVFLVTIKALCAKTVYHAEEQHHDGKVYHTGCLSKNRTQAWQDDQKGRNATYQQKADVSPAYYRTADGSGDARMEDGSTYKGAPQPGVVGSPNFTCGECSAVVTANQHFCGSCGSKLG